MKEEWRPCSGFEGFYEVSNTGQVRSIAVYSYKYKRVLKRKSPKLKAQETTREGYKRVLLSIYGVQYHCAVHRLVARAFVPNPENLPCVNHKDEVTGNNNADNLEWCTWKYNSNYGTLPRRISERMAVNHPTSKTVNQYKIDGTFVTSYRSLNDAGRAIGVTGGMIGRVCKGKSKTAGGFIFKYA